MLAVAACVLGYLAKDQLAVLFAVLGLPGSPSCWRGRADAPRSGATWTRGDWVGAVDPGGRGSRSSADAYVAHRSSSWYVTTTFFQDRMLELRPLGRRGADDRARHRAPRRRPRVARAAEGRGTRGRACDALAVVTVASIVVLRLLHRGQGRLPVDRLRDADARAQPHLPRPAAVRGNSALLRARRRAVVGRRRGRRASRSTSSAHPLLARRSTRTTRRTGSRSPRSRTASSAGRPTRSSTRSSTVTIVGDRRSSRCVPRLRGSRRRRALGHGRSQPSTLAWTGRPRSTRRTARASSPQRLYETLPKPANWLDRETGGRPVVFLGQAVTDPNPVNLLEFWNRVADEGLVARRHGARPRRDGDARTSTSPTGRSRTPHTDFVARRPPASTSPAAGSGRRSAATSSFRLDGRSSGSERPRRGSTRTAGWAATASYAQYDVPPGERGTRPGRPLARALVRQGRAQQRCSSGSARSRVATSGQPTIER